LPLYRFVESRDASFPLQSDEGEGGGLRFRPGCSVKKSTTVASLERRQLDVALRHNEIQRGVYDVLAMTYGSGNVGTECPSGTGARVDVVVRRGGGHWYYEIKTDLSARACVRAALPQLLEYALWPRATEAQRLVVVGEPPLDGDTAAYLRTLRGRFDIPIHYAQFEGSPLRLSHSCCAGE
jgi:hypothetical protein